MPPSKKGTKRIVEEHKHLSPHYVVVITFVTVMMMSMCMHMVYCIVYDDNINRLIVLDDDEDAFDV